MQAVPNFKLFIFLRQVCIFLVIVWTGLCLAQSTIPDSDDRLHQATLWLFKQTSVKVEDLGEGFGEKVEGGEIDYYSPLPDIQKALLTRATDGRMRISWKTGAIERNAPCQLVWLAGLGSNLGEKPFDLYVNGEKYLTFTSSVQEHWIVQGINGSRLEFQATVTDAVGDRFGFMILTLPAGVYADVKPVELAVAGQASGSNAWYMIFMYDHAARAMAKTMQEGFWYRLRWHNDQSEIILEMPLKFTGKKVIINRHKPLQLKPDGNFSAIRFSRQVIKEDSIKIYLEGRLIDQLPGLIPEAARMKIFDDGMLVQRTFGDSVLLVSASYFSGFASGIQLVSNSRFAAGYIELITSSHQDIAWMDNPTSCMELRDTMILTPAFDLLARNPDYHYTAEQALMLYEYLQRHPERLPEIQQYSRAGRLEWGASFNQPYEGLYYGESLLRQFYFGRRWLKQMLPGYEPRVYFNVDVPGRTLQMPQIARKCGVEFMIISRHQRGFFYWQSPDGSRIGVHSPGHYHHASEFLRQSLMAVQMATPQVLTSWENTYNRYQLPPYLPVIYSSDMSTPQEMKPLFKAWENVEILSRNSVSGKSLSLPRWRYNTAAPVLKKIFTEGQAIPVIQGERPNVWLYIHGPTHHRAISESRLGGRLLPAAEIFSTIACLLEGDFTQYPQQELNQAWQAHIYPDHGWGGKDGHITDQTFWDKYRFAREEAQRLLRLSLLKIRSHIITSHNPDVPLIVFNALSRKRTIPVTVNLSFNQADARSLDLFDSRKKKIESVLDVQQTYEDGSIKEARLTFIAAEIPSLGYRTFYLKTEQKKRRTNHPNNSYIIPEIFENKFYRITFSPGGIKQVYDKSLQVNLFRSDKFLAGELIALRSAGNGAGEFSEIQQPDTGYFERLSQYQPEWKCLEQSPVCTRYKIQQRLNNSVFEEQVIIYQQVKRIDFEINILGWDGTPYREYRLMFPVADQDARITYEVPFGRVTVGEDEIPGAAGERYVQPAKEVHPREVLDWISASGSGSGVTFSSDVAVWDYKDPTGDPVEYPVLQPLLLASRKSCHPEGNWYLQAGDHHYRFTMTSHAPGWTNGYLAAKGANHEFLTFMGGQPDKSAELPDEYSFCSLSAPNVQISTIKKAEDDNQVVLRLYEMEGLDSDVKLDWFRPVIKLDSTSAIEEGDYFKTNMDNNIQLRVGHHSIETYKLDCGIK